jgi:hypothetical protein
LPLIFRNFRINLLSLPDFSALLTLLITSKTFLFLTYERLTFRSWSSFYLWLSLPLLSSCDFNVTVLAFSSDIAEALSSLADSVLMFRILQLLSKSSFIQSVMVSYQNMAFHSIDIAQCMHWYNNNNL